MAHIRCTVRTIQSPTDCGMPACLHVNHDTQRCTHVHPPTHTHTHTPRLDSMFAYKHQQFSEVCRQATKVRLLHDRGWGIPAPTKRRCLQCALTQADGEVLILTGQVNCQPFPQGATPQAQSMQEEGVHREQSSWRAASNRFSVHRQQVCPPDTQQARGWVAREHTSG